MKTMHKIIRTITIVSLASAASFAHAQDTNGISNSNADSSVMSGPMPQELSSRWGSPAVNRSARPADPIPKVTTRTEEAKRFAAQEAEWQRLSTP